MAVAGPHASTDASIVWRERLADHPTYAPTLSASYPSAGQEVAAISDWAAALAAQPCVAWSVSATLAGQLIDTVDCQRERVIERVWRSASGETAPEQRERSRPPLGERLAAIRARIVASGRPLLSWDELDAELADIRDQEPHAS